MGQGLGEDPRAQLWEVLWGRVLGSTRASIEQCALQTCCASCRQSVEYTQDNLTEAMRCIPSTGSSLGDTNLLGTLRSVYNTSRPRGHTRQVWVQGHGGVEEQVSQGEKGHKSVGGRSHPRYVVVTSKQEGRREVWGNGEVGLYL